MTEKESHRITSLTGLEIGATGMQGWRLEMEDQHIITDMPSLTNHTFLAVFDGHGGMGAALYAQKHLIETIEATQQWKTYVLTGAKNIPLLGEALTQAFLNIDDALRIHQNSTNGKDCSGCTAVTAMITPTTIVCANAGDSRCVLGTKRTAKFLSSDHKPYDLIEKTRIENAGGCVQYDRVDGDLAVSRAFGDFQWKARNDLKPQEQRVSCYPDIMVHTRVESEDEILILACDGLWDVFSNEDCMNLVFELFQAGESNVVLLAEELADAALDRGD